MGLIPGQGAKGFLGGSVVKNPPAIAGVSEDTSLIPGSRRFPWRRKWQPTPVFLPGESHGQRSLVGCSPRGHKELDMTERLSMTVMTRELSSPIVCSQKTKTENRNNIITNSIKILKVDHIKKSLKN